jgi:hypothetical protein
MPILQFVGRTEHAVGQTSNPDETQIGARKQKQLGSVIARLAHVLAARSTEWLKPGALGSKTKDRVYPKRRRRRRSALARPGCVFIQTIELSAT